MKQKLPIKLPMRNKLVSATKAVTEDDRTREQLQSLLKDCDEVIQRLEQLMSEEVPDEEEAS